MPKLARKLAPTYTYIYNILRTIIYILYIHRSVAHKLTPYILGVYSWWGTPSSQSSLTTFTQPMNSPPPHLKICIGFAKAHNIALGLCRDVQDCGVMWGGLDVNRHSPSTSVFTPLSIQVRSFHSLQIKGCVGLWQISDICRSNCVNRYSNSQINHQQHNRSHKLVHTNKLLKTPSVPYSDSLSIQ
jgi:hypothetical protein